MKQTRLALTYVVAFALATGAYAAAARVHAPASAAARDGGTAHGILLPLSWAPDWLMTPLSRAIADATDPRERVKGTGEPKR